MAKKKEKTLEEKLQEALVPENQWPYILPENWCWLQISKLYDVGSSKRIHKSDWIDKGIPFIRTRELVKLSETGYVDNDLFISELLYEELKAKYGVPKCGDILISGVGTIGVPYIVKGKKQFYFKDGNVIWLKPKVKINASYIFWLYKSQFVVNQIKAMSSGTTVDTYTITNANNTLLPIPPLLEQKRIVHRVESLFAKLDEAKEKIQQVLDGAEMRKAAILHKAFTGELTKTWRKENGISEDSWESVKLKELGEFNRGKSKHRPRNDPRLFNGPYPFIQTGDVSSSGMYIQKHSQTLSEFGMQQSRLFPKDTLCITIAANIGKVAILTYDCCFPDSVVGFTPNERTFSKYMYYSMLKIQKEIEALAPAVAQKNLSLKLLLDVNVQIPSVEEQHTIVKIIERLLKHEKNVISSSMRSIESIETMKKSILAKAFRGELGTNNPTEYSALNLLKEVLQDKS